MLFNSLTFALFLPLVFAAFWSVRGRAARNAVLLLASYVFYGWWDWRFLGLIVLSSLVDHQVGLALGRTTDPRARRRWLGLSLAANLGMLGTFKYYDFFVTSLAGALAPMGIHLHPFTLDWVLPVGISFYTFQTLSYTIDVYRRDLEPTRDMLAFFAYVAFFPQLVAGPIERATNLLPQFLSPRRFDPARAVDGLRQMLWGLFKKVVIADNCARVVDDIFSRSDTLPGPVLVLGAVLFAFQIYGDFSGYSDIAIGAARLFGIGLMRNFAFPYFSRDIAEFWRRWHISLNTWFRDYLYIPLGGSRGGTGMRVRNTVAIFAVSGIWHGANWTFLMWGLLNALYFLPLLLTGRNRRNTGTVAQGRLLPFPAEAAAMAWTFFITCVAWVFFRAKDIAHAMDYLTGAALRMGHGAWLSAGRYLADRAELLPALAMLLLLVAVEWVQREREHALEHLPFGRPLRWSVYWGLGLAIIFIGDHGAQEFIYFQF